MNIPFITVNQMIEVDKLMIEGFNINLLQMMENAWRILSEFAIDKFNPKKVTILIWKWNNGWWWLVCARYLHNKWIIVEVILSEKN